MVERRQRLSRYVRWAVGGAAVVCLAALARTTMMPRLAGVAAAEMPLTTTTAAEGLAPLAAAQPTEPIKPAEPASAAATPPATPPAAEPASAVAPRVDVPKAAEATKGDEVKPAAAALPTGDKTALQEKNDSRRSLERGKLADAIEAGERSVALDPQDGEAWLLLGAAYQEKGKGAEARRCYTSCLKEGKRGPLGECRAMIR